MVATSVAATFFMSIAVHRVGGQAASEKSRPPLARRGRRRRQKQSRASSNASDCRCALFDGVRQPGIERLPCLPCTCASCGAQRPSRRRADVTRSHQCVGDAQAISSRIAPPRLRTPPALCLPLWLALPDDSIANQAAHRNEQRSAAVQRHCTQRSCIRLRCAARHRAGHGACHRFEACANGAVRSGHACAL